MIGLGGGAQLGIGIAVHLENKFSSEANRVARSMQQIRDEQFKLNRQAVANERNRSAAIAASAMAGTVAIAGLIQKGATYQQQLRKVSVLSKDSYSPAQLKKMSMEMSDMFRTDPTQVMGALFENVKAGVTTGIEQITKYQLAVATATGEALEGEQGVAKGLLNIVNAFEVPYTHFAHVANAVATAANASQASVTSLNEAFKYSANVAHGAGLSYQESLAALAMLSQYGIEGSSAGTALSNLIRYSSKAGGALATKKGMWGLGQLGLKQSDLRDAQGNVIGVLDLIDKIRGGLVGKGTGQKTDILDAVFGVRGEKAALNLLGSGGGKGARQFLAEIHEGIRRDAAMTQAKEMMDTLQGDFNLVKVKWVQFAIAFTDAVEPILRRAIPVLVKMLEGLIKFSKTGFGKTIAIIVTVVTPLVMALFAFRAAVAAATYALMGLKIGAPGFGQTIRGGMGAWGRTAQQRPLFTYAGGRGGGGGYSGGPKSGLNRSGYPVGPMGGWWTGAARMNKAGRYYVRAGQTFTTGGYTYGPGSYLPRTFNPVQMRTFGAPLANPYAAVRFGGGLAAASGAATAGRLAGIAGTAGRALGVVGAGLGRVVGILGGPWGMGIMLALQFLPMIFDWLKSEDTPTSVAEDLYKKGYTLSSLLPMSETGYDADRVKELKKLGLGDVAKGEIVNKINVYLDGKQVANKEISSADNAEANIILSQLYSS